METEQFIGKTLVEAREILKNTKFYIHTDRRDDSNYLCTADFNTFRIRVEIDNNIITSVNGVH